jgi:cytochrome c-type biogenesis protein CcmH/NrfF
MTRRSLSWLALAAVVAGTLVFAASRSGQDGSVEARTRRILAGLRCPSCEGQSVADTPSSVTMAGAIQREVRRRVEAGESAEEIRQVYVDRFGEEILLSPPSDGAGVLVWVLPLLALIAAVGGLAMAFRRWGRQPVLTADDEDRALVEQARLERLQGGA